jgi:hypothetical protein
MLFSLLNQVKHEKIGTSTHILGSTLVLNGMQLKIWHHPVQSHAEDAPWKIHFDR